MVILILGRRQVALLVGGKDDGANINSKCDAAGRSLDGVQFPRKEKKKKRIL